MPPPAPASIPSPKPTESRSGKPKTKKRVSLADYKSLRRVSSCSTPSTPVMSETGPSFTNSNAMAMPQQPASSSMAELEATEPEADPGTPTQDEQPLSSTSSSAMIANLPPTLNTLPLFEKLDKLELAQQEMKRKGL